MAFNLKKIDENKFEYINKKGETKYFTKANLNTFLTKGYELIIDGVPYDGSVTPQQNQASSSNTEAIFNLKKIDENKFEYINKKGETKYFTKANLDTFLAKGKKLMVDGQPYGPDQPQSMEKKINAFTTTDNVNFIFNDKSYPKAIILKNLKKGARISINGEEVTLNHTQDDFIPISKTVKPFDINKANVESMINSAPADTMPIITIKVKQDENGDFWFKGNKVPRKQIINTLKHGKYVSINDKLIQLTDDRTDFEYVPEPEPVKQSEPKPTPTQPKIFALTTVDENTFLYPVKNKTLKRTSVIANLKKGLSITVDSRLIKLTPDGLDFGFADEIAALERTVKPIEEVKAEAEQDSVRIINIKNNLPTYFNDDSSIEESSTIAPTGSDSESYRKMKELQKRLFSLSADSNMINVENDRAKTIDFGKFISKYEELRKDKEILKRLLAGENIIFTFGGTSETSRKIWNKMMKFNSIVTDTYKEMGDDYLNLGFPTMAGDIIDKTNELNEKIHINAPLFLVKSKFVINNKDKNLTFLFSREKQQLFFQANKELLLYLATKLNKTIKLDNYRILFDQTFHSVEDQINKMEEFLTEIGLSFDKQLVLDSIDKFTYTVSNIDFDQEKGKNLLSKPIEKKTEKKVSKKTKQNIQPSLDFSKQSTNVEENKIGLSVYQHCFMGVFKTLNCEIFKDYDKILEQEVGREYWGKLDHMVPDQLNYFIKMGEDFKESDLRQIVPLDYSQKTACKLAINDSINIVGPAGTGKSQTIANIIANFIDKHKSALFVAEKKTATDVVFNRLKNLRYYCLPLFDKENWNEALTKALRQTLKRVGSIYGSWEALELDDSQAQEQNASDTLDKKFAEMKTFRKLMCGKEGYALPKLTIKFSSEKLRQQLKDIEYVQSEFDASETAGDFWAAIRKIKLERRLLVGCQAMLESITDKEFYDNEELINKFFKACKYIDSKTFYDNELVQILQNAYSDKEIVPNPNIEEKSELNAYKQTDNLYKKFAQLLTDMKVSHAATINDIKELDHFVTYGYIKQLKAKIQKIKPTATQAINYGVPAGFGQQQTNGNPYIVNGQFVNPQQPQMMQPGQNPYMQQMMQNNQQQYASNMPVQGQPQYGQQPMYGQQMQGQGFPQQQMMGQTPQQPQQSIDPVMHFAEKYNIDNFNFSEIKQYLKLQKEFKENKNVADLLKLQPTVWFNEQAQTMLDKTKLDLTFSELNFLRYVRNQIKSNSIYSAQYNKLYGIVDNCNKLDDVEDILQRFGAIIALLYPIVIASPNLVCKYIQPRASLFNHVVIDEASMLSLEKAIPILYRGKKFCVVGDSKQLQPLSYLEQLKKLDLYKRLYLNDKIKKEDLLKQQRLVNEYKGVLDFIGQKVQKTTLQYHYRSARKEVVRFSSVAFYDNEMITANNYSDKATFADCGVFVKQVNGEYKKGVNQLECKALYDELLKIAKMNKEIIDVAKKISVGIIVFSSEQKDYLNNLISEKADPDVLNMEVMFNQETGEDNSLFIKDVESVQGDERDVILMSLGSSSKNKTEMISSFGLLNTDLGPNFLNVMITRARKKLVVFKSFHFEDVPNTGNSAINVYKDFIKYIDLLSNPDQDKVKNQIDNLFKEYILRSATIDYSSLSLNMNESYLGQELLPYFSKYINQNKYKLVQDYPTIQGQKFGLVAVDRKTNLPEFALIFDDFIKNLYKTAKQSEYYDYQFLLSRGWKFNKITALDWANLLSTSKTEEKEKNIIEFIKKQLQFGKVSYFDDSWTGEEKQPEQLSSKTIVQPAFHKKSTKKATHKKASKKASTKTTKNDKIVEKETTQIVKMKGKTIINKTKETDTPVKAARKKSKKK